MSNPQDAALYAQELALAMALRRAEEADCGVLSLHPDTVRVALGQSGYKIVPVNEPSRDDLEEWLDLALTYSSALLAARYHPAGKHQLPDQYDADSELACTLPNCLRALASAQRQQE